MENNALRIADGFGHFNSADLRRAQAPTTLDRNITRLFATASSRSLDDTRNIIDVEFSQDTSVSKAGILQ